MAGEKPSTYKEAGVNIELGDTCSEILYNACKETWENRRGALGEIVVPHDDFSGIRYINISSLANTVMNVNFDGIGTKVEIAERLGKHDTMAFDLFAMVCDDAARQGGEPVVVGSILDANRLDLEVVRALARGMVRAAREAGVAVINGETAELGDRIGGYGSCRYNWGGAALWVGRPDRILTGREIEPGHLLIGVKEEGFRSNGLSLVRKILSNRHGEKWHNVRVGKESLGEMVLQPSRIYSRFMVSMTGGHGGEPKAKVEGLVHVTGGGLPGKVGRILKVSRRGADILEPLPPPEIMLLCQREGGVPDREAYQTWNMGHGLVAISPDPAPVLALAREFGLEARVIGEVTKNPVIRIRSLGTEKRGERILEFPLEGKSR